MKINRSNYEITIIDWLDGNLNDQESTELLLFLSRNPDLKEEIEALRLCRLDKPFSEFPLKDILKKTPSELTDSQYEFLCIARVENDLNTEQEKEFYDISQQTDERRKIFELFKKTLLFPLPYKYAYKNTIKKKTAGDKFLRVSAQFLSAAATIALIVTVYMLIPRNLPVNPVTVISEPTVDTLAVFRTNPIASGDINPGHKSDVKTKIEEEKYTTAAEVITSDIKSVNIDTDAWPVRKLKIPGTLTYSVNQGSAVNLSADLISYDPEIIIAGLYDDDRTRIGKFLSRTYRDLVLKEEEATDLPVKAYEFAEGGINGLNRLLGWKMALLKTNDENGDLQSLYFSSKMLKFNAPVKKSTTTP